jgi:hypothetical protein
MMRSIVEDTDAATARAARARSRVLRDFSPTVTGTFIRDRLAAVREGAAHDRTPENRSDWSLKRLAARALRGRRI